MKIGVPLEYFEDGLDPEVRAAVEFGIQELDERRSRNHSASRCRTPPTRFRRTT